MVAWASLDPVARAADTAAEIAALKKQNAALQAKIEKIEASVKTLSSNKTASQQKPSSSQTKPAEKTASSQQSIDAPKVLNANLKELKTSGETVSLKDISTAFDVPESPAAGVLGVSTDKVQHLKTPKQVVVSAINGLDEHGHFQSGTAVDFAPAQWWLGHLAASKFRYSGEKENFGENALIWLRRTAVRTQLSFAGVKGVSDADKSNKLALGIHSVLISGDDPLSNADAVRVNSKGEEVGLDSAEPYRVISREDGKPLDAYGQSLNQWVGNTSAFQGGALARVANNLYSHASWAVGVAPEWMAADDSSHYTYAGTTAWSSFAYSLDRGGMFRFILDAIYHDQQKVAASNTATSKASPNSPITQDSLFVIGGVRFGNRDFNATATVAYEDIKQHGIGSDTAYRFTIAAEKRLSLNTWLTLAVSKDSGNKLEKNATLVLGGVKFGLGGRDFKIEEQHQRAAEHQEL